MTLDQAREWASRHDHIRDVFHPDAKAAIEVIQSLPDKWVDAEKLRELINRREKTPPSSVQERDFVRELWGLIHEPKLRTLAEMTQEEREKCLFMQCMIGDDTSEYLVIASTGEFLSGTISESGASMTWNNDLVTPLPNLPKMEWPDSGDAPTVSNLEKVADDQAVAKDVCNRESNRQVKFDSSPQPEPKVDEVWIVEEEQGGRGVGRFAGEEVEFPWFILLDEGTYDSYKMGSVTPICRMVPETPALPEGMRLADHTEYGRVVVAPHVSNHGDESIFILSDSVWGASHAYRPTTEFTFLDGETK